MIQTYADHIENHALSEPQKFNLEELQDGETIINLGPQHPATHGVLRLEALMEGEQVKEVAPHIGYLHRCFEKHAENLPYNQIIPFVDRLDYAAAMNAEHGFVMGAEKMLGIQNLPKRVEYIRVLAAELNRVASHLIAIGTYGMDLGAFTPFLWMMRDREHILRMLEWASGARMLYNYMWVGGLYYDLPIGFEERCKEFTDYFKPKLKELEIVLIENKIFVERTANVGVLPMDLAINCGVTGPMLRASGLRFDLRRVDGYSVYPELEFNIPVGEGMKGKTGDCWDRTYVRFLEIHQSLHIINQCAEKLTKEYKRTPEFDPRAMLPRKIRPAAGDYYSRSESPKGELGYFFRADGKSDIPYRCKVRSPCFSNLSALPHFSKGVLLADLIAILGSIDVILGEVDR
ncbi:MAG: NADH-quinone oxidoreductase subunit NuoD [Candidatus Nephrothrix sp. EaCA]|nr:MAG: NADH-quinone oxidoreductase subunit NuoD [Candidatus Nephrothrix sp. EaCA]